MKTLGVMLITLMTCSVAYSGELSCEGNLPEHSQLEFEGRLIGGWIKNAKATVTPLNDSHGDRRVGRAAVLDPDKNYQPRRYKNHSRYVLTNLTDTENFARFMPVDSCLISVMIPKNAMSRNRFPAPVVVNCDQSGGSFTMTCRHDRSDDDRE